MLRLQQPAGELIKIVIKELARALEQANWKLVTAESCTGGLVAGALTEIPGSSLWFERGFVTYSNVSKQELLGVPEALLIDYGAVSKQVAIAMAEGALQNSAAQLSLSVTGIAGPDGGSIEKPVGLVWFGWAARGKQAVSAQKHFQGTRHEIRMAAVDYALSGALSMMADVP